VAVASIAEVRAVLCDDEALLMFLDTDDRIKPIPEETFIWVITKSATRWVQSPLGTKAVTERAAALRCGLDPAAWDDEKGRASCRVALPGYSLTARCEIRKHGR
jgi:hypothetical protein